MSDTEILFSLIQSKVSFENHFYGRILIDSFFILCQLTLNTGEHLDPIDIDRLFNTRQVENLSFLGYLT